MMKAEDKHPLKEVQNRIVSFEQMHPEVSKLRWKFLYSPPDTIGIPNGMVLLGLNPGGSEGGNYENELAATDGSAYLNEDWGGRGPILQERVCILFQRIHERLNYRRSWKHLLNRTLSGNVVPFRSQSWKSLPKRKECFRFGVDLWRYVFANNKPKIVICIGNGRGKTSAYTASRIAMNAGNTRRESRLWGSYSIKYARSILDDTTIIGLPHLSWCGFLESKQAQIHVTEMLDVVESAWTGH